MPRKISSRPQDHLEAFISCAKEFRKLAQSEVNAQRDLKTRLENLQPAIFRWQNASAEEKPTMKTEYLAACQLHESETYVANIRQNKLVAFDAAIGHLARWCATSMTESPSGNLVNDFDNKYAQAMSLRVEHLDGKSVEFEATHYFSQVLANMLNYRSAYALHSDINDAKEGRPTDPSRKRKQPTPS